MAPCGLDENARRNALFLQEFLEDFEAGRVFGCFIHWWHAFWDKRKRKCHGVDDLVIVKVDDVRRDFFRVVSEQWDDVDFMHGNSLG